jgi:mono/diheme cytochrome c family protein
MNRKVTVALAVGLALVILAGFAFARTLRYGFSAHDQPTAIEAFIARTVRHWAVPADLRNEKNPVALTPEVLAEARAHWADHCAICHGNDGKGQTAIGQGVYPKAPDMTLPATQSMSDGEQFSIIENGIRLTAMPGWGDGTAESAYGSWTLVHFIRHLPQVTPHELEEMGRMNPISRAELEEEKESEAFLEGADEPAPEPHDH